MTTNNTYIFGDIQGCFDELMSLLNKINYDPSSDRLGFVGDLVNRGPKSLETLRFIKNLNEPIVVLGNHDLHLLCMDYDTTYGEQYNQGLTDIRNADDKQELLDWLRQQPIMHLNKEQNYCLVHAGIPPQWSIEQAYQYSNELHEVLSGDDRGDFLRQMHGNQPEQWHSNLTGTDRLRYITNALTRLRFCTQDGTLDLDSKHKTPANITYKAWFDWRDDEPMDIIFGHWAALRGECNKPGFYALDTGCVWGNALTALRLEDKKIFCTS